MLALCEYWTDKMATKKDVAFYSMPGASFMIYNIFIPWIFDRNWRFQLKTLLVCAKKMDHNTYFQEKRRKWAKILIIGTYVCSITRAFANQFFSPTESDDDEEMPLQHQQQQHECTICAKTFSRTDQVVCTYVCTYEVVVMDIFSEWEDNTTRQRWPELIRFFPNCHWCTH
jgi:hypothetical protein